jgi:hypothetical protein
MHWLADRLRGLADRIERAQSPEELEALQSELCDLTVDLCDCCGGGDEESATPVEHPTPAR